MTTEQTQTLSPRYEIRGWTVEGSRATIALTGRRDHFAEIVHFYGQESFELVRRANAYDALVAQVQEFLDNCGGFAPSGVTWAPRDNARALLESLKEVQNDEP